MSDAPAVIFFSKDRAMQLDAAIRSFYAHCKDTTFAEKVIIHTTSDLEHHKQYKQLEKENPDFTFVRENDIVSQIVEIAKHWRFVSFHCDDNIYIRDFSFAQAVRLLRENRMILGHSFRLGKNVTYSYTRNSPEVQPQFTYLRDNIMCFDWTKMKPRGFGYPLEVSASVYRSNDIIPLILKNPDCAVGNIESYLKNYKNVFFTSSPFVTCNVEPSVISVPVNRVGVVHNKAGTKHNYSIKYLAWAFRTGRRIDVSKFDNYITNSTHVELELSFTQVKK